MAFDIVKWGFIVIIEDIVALTALFTSRAFTLRIGLLSYVLRYLSKFHRAFSLFYWCCFRYTLDLRYCDGTVPTKPETVPSR